MAERVEETLRLRLEELSVQLRPLPDSAVDQVEVALGVQLPIAVRTAIKIWSGGESVGAADMRSWDPDDADKSRNIVAETLRLRDALHDPWPAPGAEVWPNYLTFLLAMCDEKADLQADGWARG